MKQITLFVFLLFTCTKVFSQFVIDADIRPRFEYRHGFGNLFPDDAKPAAFVEQRTRLNLNYGMERLKVSVSIQDVSVWGDTRQIDRQDSNLSLSLFGAWVQYEMSEKWAIKLGRQVLSYDDERILGGLDWAMQGRFHDLVLIKFNSGGFKLDVGFAFNQERPRLIGNDYSIQGFFSYKVMQFAHLNKTWDNVLASFLFMNNGFQAYTGDNNDQPNGVFYRQTTGAHVKFPIGNVGMYGNAYYQSGKSDKNTTLNAYNLLLEAKYQPNKTLFGLGLEILSGTDQDGDTQNKSFFPLYGTNHKFNGYMDYFYVGNHVNNVGLNDIYAKVVFQLSQASNLLVKGHYFAANAKLSGDADPYLGTEVDLVYTHNLIKNVKLNVGYSHMFASTSMSLIKNGLPNNNTNNWAWVQLTIRPTLYNSANSK
ncbi:alginate export family protein [Winogradskyella aurantiaca]|uniref:hypothetical protein n=1 Tax=Winogradskyella aurantiaca TaxID=2219558 RepID=UPI000E1D9457|nr:hypothetical protein [Winogradskyella aurantiaca]